jgi:hypothetical protein
VLHATTHEFNTGKKSDLFRSDQEMGGILHFLRALRCGNRCASANF